MAGDTFKKRQQDRREKQQNKTARGMERRNEKAGTANTLQQEEPAPRPESKEHLQLGRPKYLSCLIRPKDFKKKTEITLYAARKR